MRLFLFSLLLFGVGLVTTQYPSLAAEKEGGKLKKLLPLKVEDYQADGKDEFYDRQTSFQYMDGAAELYRAYAFKLLMVRKYVKKDHPSILVELYDMGASEDAFGIFSYQTEEEEVGIGQGSDYGGGLLRFWKGRYFVSVYVERETPATRDDILTIGRAIAKNIEKDGPKPKLIQLLPEEGLAKNIIRYFHLHQVLNHHYFISHNNIFNLGPQTNAVLATYLFPGERAKTVFLLIQYPEQKQAEEGFKSFIKAYMPEATSSKPVKTENGKWTSARLYQKYVLVVFDAPSQEKAELLIESTEKNFKRRRP